MGRLLIVSDVAQASDYSYGDPIKTNRWYGFYRWPDSISKRFPFQVFLDINKFENLDAYVEIRQFIEVSLTGSVLNESDLIYKYEYRYYKNPDHSWEYNQPSYQEIAFLDMNFEYDYDYKAFCLAFGEYVIDEKDLPDPKNKDIKEEDKELKLDEHFKFSGFGYERRNRW